MALLDMLSYLGYTAMTVGLNKVKNVTKKSHCLQQPILSTSR